MMWWRGGPGQRENRAVKARNNEKRLPSGFDTGRKVLEQNEELKKQVAAKVTVTQLQVEQLLIGQILGEIVAILRERRLDVVQLIAFECREHCIRVLARKKNISIIYQYLKIK